MAESLSSWHNIRSSGHAQVQNGHIYGDVHNTFYDSYKSLAERLLDSLSFSGMYRYQERPLESRKGTYEWLFDDRRVVTHSCEHCAHVKHGTECRECWRELPTLCYKAVHHAKFLVTEASKFRSWLGNSQDIFWISGKAGAGKSCLMKFLLEHDSTADLLREWAGQPVTVAGFFFWAAGGDLEKSYIGLLRSLLYQILESLPRVLGNFVLGKTVSDIEQPWSIKRLNKVFSEVVGHLATCERFIFFIDGLDEFKGDIMDLTAALNTLNGSPNIKLCVSSRPWNVFEKAYGSRPCKQHLRLHEINGPDIDAYVRGRLIEDLGTDESSEIVSSPQHYQLVTAIRNRSEGVFLWVYLVVKRLREAFSDSWNAPDMLALLDETPAELADLIQAIFNSIHPIQRQAAARTFLMMLECEDARYCYPHLLWLSHSDRSRIGVVRTGNLPPSYVDLHEMVDDADRSIRKSCKDLVDIVRGRGQLVGPSIPGDSTDSVDVVDGPDYVNFPHRTIRDFIAKQKADGILQRLAGEDFCPAFALCSSVTRVATFLRTPGALLEKSLTLTILLSSEIRANKEALLVDMANSLMESGGLYVQCTLTNGHFLKSLGYANAEDVPDLSDETAKFAIFMAFILYRGGFRLFLLMFASTCQHHNLQSVQLWLGVLLSRRNQPDDVVFAAQLVEALPRLLQHGADLNEPIRRQAGTCSVWQQYLYDLHALSHVYLIGIRPNVVSILLHYGADPDVDINSEKLYRFLELDERTNLIPQNIQELDASSGTDLSPSMLGTHGSSESDGNKVESRHAGRRWVPATAAFGVPSHNAKYLALELKYRPAVEEFFPIIKAQLVAASEEKARKQRIKNGEATDATTRKWWWW